MIGLDFRLTRLDLLLEHKSVTAVHVKYGQIQQCCLGLSANSGQFGTFLIFDQQHMPDLMKGNVEVEIMARDKKILGTGKTSSCELTEGQPCVPIIAASTFKFIGGTSVQTQIIHKTKGKPDMSLGAVQLSISIYELLLRKGCNCDIPVKAMDERDYTLDRLPDADSMEDTSIEESGSDSDSSLDNFLARLNSITVAQQTTPSKHKLSSATQTQFPNVRSSFTKKVLRVSKDFGAADVVAVVAPTHLAVQGQQNATHAESSGRHRQLEPAVNSYAFIDTPPVRVTLAKRPSSTGTRPGTAPTRRGAGPTSKQRTTAALAMERPSSSGAAAGKGKAGRGNGPAPPLQARRAHGAHRANTAITKPAWF